MKIKKIFSLLCKVDCVEFVYLRKKCFYVISLFLLFVLSSCEEKETRMIVCWGDSLTAPHFSSSWKGKIKYLLFGDDSYPAVLQSKLGEGYNIVNAGVGGENTLTIMARQGAYPMTLAHDVTIYRDENKSYDKFVGDRDIPAFYSSYNGKPVTPLLQLGWDEESPAKMNPCYIDGEEYVFISDSHFWKEDGKYVFEYNYNIDSKKKIIETKILKKDTAIETYAMRHLRNAYANVFFMGQNGGFKDVADLIVQYKAMIDYSRCDKYVIVGFHKPNPCIPTITRMKEMEDSLQQAFGNHYINLRDYMVKNGLKDAVLTPTNVDNDSISKEQVPPQLIPDGCHFTSEGYCLLAELVRMKMVELGYISDKE